MAAKSPSRTQFGLCVLIFVLAFVLALFAHRRQIRTTPMRHFRRHANRLTQRWMRMNGFADIYGICTHLNR